MPGMDVEHDDQLADGKAKFSIRRAVLTANGSAGICAFDVLPDYFMGKMNRGTKKLMRHFIEAIGVRTGTVRGWSVEPMCTPFYGFKMDATDWRDRVAEAWRVTVNLDGEVRHDIHAEKVRFWLANGEDDTLPADHWEDDTPGYWSGEPVDCVVIADCHAATVRDPERVTRTLLRQFAPEQLTVTRYPYPPFSPLVEARVTLRGLRLPDALEEVLRVQSLCEDLGMTVHMDAASKFEAEMIQAADLVKHMPTLDPDEILSTTRRYYERSDRSPYADYS
ncbi:hypothetical protein ACFY4C_37530 [Actinomadura viridis]|uniref:hypothetical protein n=1 Tax=Actinomadura viridis TaxID=58110 RepID=UPI00367F3FF0